MRVSNGFGTTRRAVTSSVNAGLNAETFACIAPIPLAEGFNDIVAEWMYESPRPAGVVAGARRTGPDDLGTRAHANGAAHGRHDRAVRLQRHDRAGRAAGRDRAQHRPDRRRQRHAGDAVALERQRRRFRYRRAPTATGARYSAPTRPLRGRRSSSWRPPSRRRSAPGSRSRCCPGSRPLPRRPRASRGSRAAVRELRAGDRDRHPAGDVRADRAGLRYRDHGRLPAALHGARRRLRTQRPARRPDHRHGAAGPHRRGPGLRRPGWLGAHRRARQRAPADRAGGHAHRRRPRGGAGVHDPRNRLRVRRDAGARERRPAARHRDGLVDVRIHRDARLAGGRGEPDRPHERRGQRADPGPASPGAAVRSRA